MKRLIIVALAALAVVSCFNRTSTPDTSFAPYVTAYTGGSVSPSGPISIRLAGEVAPEKQITEGLFSFSPSVKGTVVWNGPSSVDFIPDEPFLEEGKVYNATFALQKVLDGAPGKFPFSFMVRKSVVAEEVDTSVDDNGFRIKGIKKDLGGNPHIDIIFSENLAGQASLKGLIELEGVGRHYIDVKGNIASVYFESPGEKITLKVSSAIKSASGNVLGKDCEEEILCSEEKPQAVIALSGNILPDKGQLILPLRAVNLAAVDVSVIRIFESNVLMFLQDNDLKGERSGPSHPPPNLPPRQRSFHRPPLLERLPHRPHEPLQERAGRNLQDPRHLPQGILPLRQGRRPAPLHRQRRSLPHRGRPRGLGHSPELLVGELLRLGRVRVGREGRP